MALCNARQALEKASLKPPSKDFTSKPPWDDISRRIMALWSRKTSCMAQSPSRWVMAVKPSMSLKMMATVPPGAAWGLKSGRSFSTAKATG